jgi:Cu/Ag efflux protein CusF
LVSPETENKNLDLKTKTFTASGKINENKTPQFNDSPGEKKEIIGIKKIEVSFKKVWIEHESELEEYIGLLKEAVLKELKKGKKVQV